MMAVYVVLIAAGVLVALLVGLWVFGERGHLVLPSTRRSVQGGGNLGLKGLHGYVYGRWSNQYIGILINHAIHVMGERGKKWLSDTYHGKVLTPELASAVITIDRDIPLQDLEQIIPYPVARSIVLEAPPKIALYECPCRQARPDPCKPTQVCMIIGGAADFIIEHNPHSSRLVTQQEALELLRAEHERGHVHSAWFKDACGDRFYAICNCCKCCCGGIEAMRHGSRMMASSGYVAEVDGGLCTDCGTCVEACPFEAVSSNGAGMAVVSREKCMGCGVCIGQCSSGAIRLARDEGKGIPLDVRLLCE